MRILESIHSVLMVKLQEGAESNISDFSRPDGDECLTSSQDGGSSMGRVPIYLLSTRAGGLVSIFRQLTQLSSLIATGTHNKISKRWSRTPLGQLKTVLVLRLVTCGEDGDDRHYYPSAEEHILRAASHKLEAEESYWPMVSSIWERLAARPAKAVRLCRRRTDN